MFLVFSQDVRLAAINALINSLDFIKENFEREVNQDDFFVLNQVLN
jgi:hypothetical protein